MKTKDFILYICLIFVPLHSFAWGSKGHKIIATLTYSILDKNIQDSLEKYLGNTSIEEASVWMDEIKNDHSYDYMKPWHYINIEKNQTIDDAPKPNIVTELNRVINELKNRRNISREQIATDLKVLIHLMGDLHQPLHDGYGSDRGGNSVHVMIENKEDNLHFVWDGNGGSMKAFTYNIPYFAKHY